MTASTVTRTGAATEAKPAFPAALTAKVWSHELATTSIDETNDAVIMGYLPAGVTCFAFGAYLDDVDNGGTALVWKITVGSTDVKTGMTIGQADAKITHSLNQFLMIDPYTTTAETAVTVTFTTAAGTPAAGTIVLVPLYLAQ